MKKINHVLFALSLLILIGCKSNPLQEVNSRIASLSQKFVPDHRTDFCNIFAEMSQGKVLLKGETTVRGLKSELIKTLDEGRINLVDSIIVLPDTTVNYNGIASLSVINLRKEPDHAAELVSQVIMGTPLLILKEEDSWLFIKTPDGYLAWTENSSVAEKTTEEIKSWKRSKRIIYMNSTGWVFSDPGCSGIVSDIVAGAIVTELKEEKDFLKISLPDGRIGFIRKADATSLDGFKNVPADGNDIINRAQSLLGIPYLWGGSSAKGADCSGFVQTVFFQNGVILQRDASMQAKHGKEIDISSSLMNLQPGDLLFFGKPGHIIHVAIYKGNGEYIHSSGRVMINSLEPDNPIFNSYRRRTLVKAMRILGSKNNGVVFLKDHPWY